MDVTIPVNTTARICVPTLGLGKITVTESNVPVFTRGRFVAGVAGIKSGVPSDGYMIFEVGSGDYSFKLIGVDKALVKTPKLLPIPDKLVVLTFDDRAKSWRTFVAPLLKSYGFGGTFFVTEADWMSYYEDDKYWISWDEIRELHEMGFEIGNHTGSHAGLVELSVDEIVEDMEVIERACEAHGVPCPTTLGVPNGPHDIKCVEALGRKGYLFGRRGITPESPGELSDFHGPAYDPKQDHPHLIPTTLLWYSAFDADSTSGREIYGGGLEQGTSFEDFVTAMKLARNGKIAVITLHGVPDYYSHCSVDPKAFAKCMKYLHDNGYTVIALRDLAKYVDPDNQPDDPYEPIRRRIQRMKTSATTEE